MVYFSMATNCPACNYTKNLLNGPNYRVGEDFYAVNEIRDNLAAHRFTLEPATERTSN